MVKYHLSMCCIVALSLLGCGTLERPNEIVPIKQPIAKGAGVVTSLLPARINYKLIETVPPNILVPPPVYEEYISKSVTTYYPHPKKAYLDDMVDYNYYVKRYLTNLSTTFSIESETYSKMMSCAEGREFPVVKLDPIPISPDLSQYSEPEEAYRAFVKYAQGLYDYATKVSTIFNESITKFNSECKVKG